MPKLNLSTISSRYASVAALNANFDAIETAIDNTLSRDGTSPNTMSVNLDMNSNRLINLADGENNQDAATVAQVNAALGASIDPTAINSSQIEYTPAGTGVVATNVQAKLREFVSVKDFGAAGDGVTDDTTAFANACAAGVGPILVPPGTYLLDDSIQPITGTHLLGIPGLSKLKKVGSDVTSYTKPFFDVMDVDDVCFDGLWFEFTVDTSREYGIVARATAEGDTQRLRVHNCIFSNVPNHIFRYVKDVWFENNVFLGGGASGALHGIATGGVLNTSTGATENTDGLVNNVVIRGNYFERTRTEAIDINWHTWNVTIDNNTVVDCDLTTGGDLIDVGGSTDGTNACRHITITGNKLYISSAAQATYGINVKQDTTDLVIANNTIRSATTGSSTAGIRVSDTYDMQISGNVIEGFQIGITTISGTSRFGINGNTFRSQGIDGIVISSAEDFIINGNTLNAASATQQGISVDTATDFIVSNNLVYNYDVDGIQIAASASDGIVSGNLVRGGAIDGIRILGPRVVVTGNLSRMNGRHGFNFDNSHLVAVGNLSLNNSQVTADQYGFNVQAGCDNSVVVGNVAGDTQSGSETQNGFLFGASDRVKFDANIAYPRKTVGDSGTTTLTNAIIGKGGNVGGTGLYKSKGATSVADGGTIGHGLSATPTNVRVSASVSGEFVSVTALGASNFTVAIKKHDNTAGTTQTVYWEAEV